jgi:hypothetical protein
MLKNFLYLGQHRRGFKYPSFIGHADTAHTHAPATHTVLWYGGTDSVGAPGTLHTQVSQWRQILRSSPRTFVSFFSLPARRFLYDFFDLLDSVFFRFVSLLEVRDWLCLYLIMTSGGQQQNKRTSHSLPTVWSILGQ